MIIAALWQYRHLVIITERRKYRHLVITCTLKERNNVNLIGETKHSPKVGGHGPVAPLWLRHCQQTRQRYIIYHFISQLNTFCRKIQKIIILFVHHIEICKWSNPGLVQSVHFLHRSITNSQHSKRNSGILMEK